MKKGGKLTDSFFFSGQEMAEIQVEKNAVTVNSAISTFGCGSLIAGGSGWGALPDLFLLYEWYVPHSLATRETGPARIKREFEELKQFQ